MDVSWPPKHKQQSQAINIATQIKDPDLDTLVNALQNDRTQLKIEDLQNSDLIITRIKAIEDRVSTFKPNLNTQHTQTRIAKGPRQDHTIHPSGESAGAQIREAIRHLSQALFRVTDLTDPIRPMAALEMQKLAIQQAKLYLNQAKLYLLNRHYLAFFQSLDACQQLIGDHFSTHTQPVVFVLQELASLAALDFATSPPTLDKSFDALKQYIALRSEKALQAARPKAPKVQP